jgi:Transglutaminase-like superfamily
MSRLQKFMALEARQKILLLQAWCLLGWYTAALLLTSFKRLTAGLDHHQGAIQPQPLPSQQRQQAETIGKLVAAAASVTPWQSRCLVQVLATRRLLAARGVPGQFFLGVRKGSEDGTDPTGLAAHAWLQCDNSIVNGEAGHEQYAVVSAFSWSSGTRESI